MIPRLKSVLLEVAEKVQKEKKYEGKEGKEELKKHTDAAVILFGQAPVYRRVRPTETPRNITALALVKVDRYMVRRGFNWRVLSWETVKAWLYEHWDDILRILSVLLPLVIV